MGHRTHIEVVALERSEIVISEIKIGSLIGKIEVEE